MLNLPELFQFGNQTFWLPSSNPSKLILAFLEKNEIEIFASGFMLWWKVSSFLQMKLKRQSSRSKNKNKTKSNLRQSNKAEMTAAASELSLARAPFLYHICYFAMAMQLNFLVRFTYTVSKYIWLYSIQTISTIVFYRLNQIFNHLWVYVLFIL